jgi:hypothetical protein
VGKYRYQPGQQFRPFVRIVLLLALVTMASATAVIWGTVKELSALKDRAAYIELLLTFILAAVIAAWRTNSNSADATVDFEDVPDPDVFVLGLYRDGVIPIEPHPAS